MMRLPLFAFLLAAPLLGHAQQPAPPQPAPSAPAQSAPASHARQPKQPKVAAAYHAAAPEQRAERLSQQLGQQLGLDAGTTAKVKAAALTRAQKIDAIQTGPESNKAKNTALQANAQEFKAALKGILTPEQYARYAAKSAKPTAE